VRFEINGHVGLNKGEFRSKEEMSALGRKIRERRVLGHEAKRAKNGKQEPNKPKYTFQHPGNRKPRY
jgi:hypothetical protein